MKTQKEKAFSEFKDYFLFNWNIIISLTCKSYEYTCKKAFTYLRESKNFIVISLN
jgi:hypothetical protein